jgi:hypothetical protein
MMCILIYSSPSIVIIKINKAEMAKVVQVSDDTLRKRLKEFRGTKLNDMTPEEFDRAAADKEDFATMEDFSAHPEYKDAEEDTQNFPPSFLKSRGEVLAPPVVGAAAKLVKYYEEQKKVRNEMYRGLEESLRNAITLNSTGEGEGDDDELGDVISDPQLQKLDEAEAPAADGLPLGTIPEGEEGSEYGGRKDSSVSATAITTTKPTAVAAAAVSGGETDDDSEIDTFLLNTEDASKKRKFWESSNSQWIQKQAEKQRKLDAGLLKVYQKKEKKKQEPASSAGTVVQKVIKEKKISKKVNLDALNNIFPTKSAGLAVRSAHSSPSPLMRGAASPRSGGVEGAGVPPSFALDGGGGANDVDDDYLDAVGDVWEEEAPAPAANKARVRASSGASHTSDTDEHEDSVAPSPQYSDEDIDDED